MIERKKFLELCQRNVVYPNTIEVTFRDLPNVFYNPISLNIWFDRRGEEHGGNQASRHAERYLCRFVEVGLL